MILCLARLICRLHGHLELLHFGPTRLTLRCARCGRETPGWRIESRVMPSNQSHGRRVDTAAPAQRKATVGELLAKRMPLEAFDDRIGDAVLNASGAVHERRHAQEAAR
jgi:hypothetical protein